MQTEKLASRRQLGTENRVNRKGYDQSSIRNSNSKQTNHIHSGKNLDEEMAIRNLEMDSLTGVNHCGQSTCGYNQSTNTAANSSSSKPKCRTGWPQHVWALELKHYDQ